MPYSGDPAASPLDEVRFLISDTGTDELLSDAEINYVIAKLLPTYTDPQMYAAFCCERIASKYAGEVHISADGVDYSGEQLQDKYTALALNLRESYARLAGAGAAPFAGGSILWDNVYGARPLNFGIGMSDNRLAGSQRPGHRCDESCSSNCDECD